VTDVERFQASRVYLAQVYADTAAKLAQAASDNPAANLWLKMSACSTAWNALVEIDYMWRASVVAGDPIDDYYREGAEAGNILTVEPDGRYFSDGTCCLCGAERGGNHKFMCGNGEADKERA